MTTNYMSDQFGIMNRHDLLTVQRSPLSEIDELWRELLFPIVFERRFKSRLITSSVCYQVPPGQDKPAPSRPLSGACCFVVSPWVRLSEVGLSEIRKSQVARSIRVAGSIVSTKGVIDTSPLKA
jgi:hypothetical protein